MSEIKPEKIQNLNFVVKKYIEKLGTKLDVL